MINDKGSSYFKFGMTKNVLDTKEQMVAVWYWEDVPRKKIQFKITTVTGDSWYRVGIEVRNALNKLVEDKQDILDMTVFCPQEVDESFDGRVLILHTNTPSQVNSFEIEVQMSEKY